MHHIFVILRSSSCTYGRIEFFSNLSRTNAKIHMKVLRHITIRYLILPLVLCIFNYHSLTPTFIPTFNLNWPNFLSNYLNYGAHSFRSNTHSEAFPCTQVYSITFSWIQYLLKGIHVHSIVFKRIQAHSSTFNWIQYSFKCAHAHSSMFTLTQRHSCALNFM